LDAGGGTFLSSENSEETAARLRRQATVRAAVSFNVWQTFVKLTLLREDAARLNRAGRVNRRVSLFDAANDAFLVDDERGARAEAAFLVEDAVIADGRAFEITEERERDLDVFGEARVGRCAVNADA